MSIITFAPIIYKSYLRKDGTYNVRIRLTVNRRSKQITTTINATPEQLTKSLKIRDRQIQRRVDELLEKMRRKVAGIDPFVANSMTPDDVVRFLSRDEEGFRLDFFGFADEIVKEIGKRNVKSGANYRYAVSSLREFAGCDALDISKITSTFLRNYERFLRDKYGDKARAVSMYASAISYIFRQARLRYNDDESDVVNIRNPYEYYHPPKQQQAPHRALSAESIQKMIDVIPTLTRAMDKRVASLFVISFATMGMNLPDLYECDAPDADGVVTYCRRKTRDRRQDEAQMRVRLDERIRPLVDAMKGKGKMLSLSSRYGFKSLENQVTRNLPAVARAAGIDERVTFYSARHTWATMAYRIGVEKGIINDCLCHVDSAMRVTDIYIVKDWERMWRANEKVLDAFDWSGLCE